MENTRMETGYFPQMPVCDRSGKSEVVSELSLPDYQPEIRRLLDTRASILSEGEFFSGTGAEMRSELVFRILYLGSDGELYSATLTDTHITSVPFEFTAESAGAGDLTALHLCTCEGVSARVLGPRRLSIRTRISEHTLALSPAFYTPTASGGDGRESGTLQSRTRKVHVSQVDRVCSDTLTLTEHIPTDTDADSTRIIDTQAEPLVSECSAVGGKINARGEVMLRILYCNDGESEHPITAARRLPFAISVDCDRPVGTECGARVSIRDIRVSTAEDGISAEVDIDSCLVSEKSVESTYICDAYSTERHSEVGMRSVSISLPVLCANGNLTQNETRPLADIGMPQDAVIIDVSAHATVENAERLGGRLTLEGDCVYRIIYRDGEEHAVCELNLPYRYSCDCENVGETGDGGDLRLLAEVCPTSPRVRSDGERIIADCELAFFILAQESKDIELADSITLGDRRERAEGETVLYYPTQGEELWDIAKRYGVDVHALAEKNSIPEDSKGAADHGIGERRFVII